MRTTEALLDNLVVGSKCCDCIVRADIETVAIVGARGNVNTAETNDSASYSQE